MPKKCMFNFVYHKQFLSTCIFFSINAQEMTDSIGCPHDQRVLWYYFAFQGKIFTP